MGWRTPSLWERNILVLSSVFGTVSLFMLVKNSDQRDDLLFAKLFVFKMFHEFAIDLIELAHKCIFGIGVFIGKLNVFGIGEVQFAIGQLHIITIVIQKEHRQTVRTADNRSRRIDGAGMILQKSTGIFSAGNGRDIGNSIGCQFIEDRIVFYRKDIEVKTALIASFFAFEMFVVFG